MKRKIKSDKPEYRLRMETADGILIANLNMEEDWTWDKSFIDLFVRRIACEKGVKVLNYRCENGSILATVEFI